MSPGVWLVCWAPAQKEQVGLEASLRAACLPREGPCRRTMFVAGGFSLHYFEGSTDACSERMLGNFVQGSERSFSSSAYAIRSD